VIRSAIFEDASLQSRTMPKCRIIRRYELEQMLLTRHGFRTRNCRHWRSMIAKSPNTHISAFAIS
jgi:hypothetical protein